MTRIVNIMRSMLSAWNDFWFSRPRFENLGLFRVLLAGTLFLMNIGRQFDLELYYTNKGILSSAMSLDVIPEFYRPYFHWFFWPEAYVPLVHFSYLLFLLLLCLGIGGRLVNLLAWILHVGFLHRNFSVAFGADLIGGFFLLLMIGTESCRSFSVMSFFKRGRVQQTTGFKSRPLSDLFTQVFYRLIQLQLCVIYAYTGYEKLKGTTWWEGTALWSVLANPQMVIFDLSFVRHLPVLVGLMTFGTLFFEMYFPVLVWGKRTRPLALTAGIVFHLGIGFLMALWGFALVMIAPYFLFMSEALVHKIVERMEDLPVFKTLNLRRSY